MASLKELYKQIETVKIEHSKGEELKGPNVRTPSLIPNQFYLGKSWKVTVEGSDNPWLALRFVGSGKEIEGTERVLNTINPRIKDMRDGDFYFFERIIDNKIGQLYAYQADECLVFGDPPVRLTFFEIKNVTQQIKPAKPVKEKAPKPTKAEDASKTAKTPKTTSKKKSDTESAEAEVVATGATPRVGAVEALQGPAEHDTEQQQHVVDNAVDEQESTIEENEQPHYIEQPHTALEGEDVVAVAEQEMPEAVEDNSERPIEELTETEEAAVEEIHPEAIHQTAEEAVDNDVDSAANEHKQEEQG